LYLIDSVRDKEEESSLLESDVSDWL